MSDYEEEEAFDQVEEGEEVFEEQPEGDEAASDEGKEHSDGAGEEHEENENDVTAEPEEEEEPLPPKRDWHGFFRLHVPSTEEPDGPVQEARIYVPLAGVPQWLRYVVADDVPYLNAILHGRDVSDPQPDEEDEEGAAPVNRDEDDEDEDEDAPTPGPGRRGPTATASPEEGEEGVAFDDDGHMVIAEPFTGGTRLRLTQLVATQEADEGLGLPRIIVDGDELVFIATVLSPEEAEAEDTALDEGEEGLPTTDLRRRVIRVQPKPEAAEDDEGAADDDDGATHSRTNTQSRVDFDDEDPRIASRASRRTDPAGDPPAALEATVQDVELEPAQPLDLRIDVTTLCALYSPVGLERLLLCKELPSMALLEGWLHILARPVPGTTDGSFSEFTAILATLSDVGEATIEKKLHPEPVPPPRMDDDGNEVPPVVDARHPPAPPSFLATTDDGKIAVPKLKMDLRWTFALERAYPNMTSTMRHLRERLLTSARVVPQFPDTAAFVSPRLVQSFLLFLMFVPRSTLLGWTRPKLEEPEAEIQDVESIAIVADDESRLTTPISRMLGGILLDLRTREARRAKGKKDLRLSAFSAHKGLLTTRFLERNTLLDPLLVAAYAPLSPASALAAASDESVSVERGSTPATPVARVRSICVDPPPPVGWPQSLQLYDSDLVCLACAQFGALDTLQEVLRLKELRPRSRDDTVGTYHLLFHLFGELHRPCAMFIADFAANHVKSIPLLTRHSIVSVLDCLPVLASVDKDDEYPTLLARCFWPRWAHDRGLREAIKSRAPSLFLRVQDEEIRLKSICEGIQKGTLTPADIESRVAWGSVSARDVYSPALLYQAAQARNAPVMAMLCRKGVVTVRRKHNSLEEPLIEMLLAEDQRQREEWAQSIPAAADDGPVPGERLLTVLEGLVQAGVPLEGVIAAGRGDVASALAQRFQDDARFMALVNAFGAKKHECSTDPGKKFGLLRFIAAA